MNAIEAYLWLIKIYLPPLFCWIEQYSPTRFPGECDDPSSVSSDEWRVAFILGIPGMIGWTILVFVILMEFALVCISICIAFCIAWVMKSKLKVT